MTPKKLEIEETSQGKYLKRIASGVLSLEGKEIHVCPHCHMPTSAVKDVCSKHDAVILPGETCVGCENDEQQAQAVQEQQENQEENEQENQD